MTQTSRSMLTKPEAPRWRAVVSVVLTAVVGIGGLHLLAGGWSEATQNVTRSVDRMLWTQALRGRPAVSDLTAVTPVWREREGASGDRIIERVDARGRLPHSTASPVAILGEVGGETLPAAVLAEQAAKPRAAEGSVLPASFQGLAAGDRVTITTTDGRIYAFEVLTQSESSAVSAADGQRLVIRLDASNGAEGDSVAREVKPIGAQHSDLSQPQQEL